MFDTDNCGFIKEEDLHNAFEKLGQEIDKSEIKRMIAEHDKKQDGILDFEEFKEMFEKVISQKLP